MRARCNRVREKSELISSGLIFFSLLLSLSIHLPLNLTREREEIDGQLPSLVFIHVIENIPARERKRDMFLRERRQDRLDTIQKKRKKGDPYFLTDAFRGGERERERERERSAVFSSPQVCCIFFMRSYLSLRLSGPEGNTSSN